MIIFTHSDHKSLELFIIQLWSRYTDPIVQYFYCNNSIGNLSDEVYFDLAEWLVTRSRTARCLNADAGV